MSVNIEDPIETFEDGALGGRILRHPAFAQISISRVSVVEDMGDAANGMCAELAIAEVPTGTAYRIDEYDGFESVNTMNDYDWNIAT